MLKNPTNVEWFWHKLNISIICWKSYMVEQFWSNVGYKNTIVWTVKNVDEYVYIVE